MTPAPGTPSLTPFPESIQGGINVNGEEGLQESSGPEARETPSSPLLVLNYGDSSTLGRKRRSTYQRLMTLLNRWEYQRRSIIRMDLTTANGGDSSKLSDHYEELIRRIKRKTGVEDIQYWKMTTREGTGSFMQSSPGTYPCMWTRNGSVKSGKRFTGPSSFM